MLRTGGAPVVAVTSCPQRKNVCVATSGTCCPIFMVSMCSGMIQKPPNAV